MRALEKAKDEKEPWNQEMAMSLTTVIRCSPERLRRTIRDIDLRTCQVAGLRRLLKQ
jgi:hypothetical protein